MVLIGRRPAPQLLYEVSDPVHPRLLCRVTGTTAHIYAGDTITYLRTAGSGTEVVLRSMSSGNESVVTSIPKAGLEGSYYGPTAWVADGSLSAATVPPAGGNQTESQVWLFSQRYAGVLYSYFYPVFGCICRFGIPQPIAAFSPDGEYVVAGFPVGKGSQGLAVYRLSDRSLVQTFPGEVGFAMWGRTGHMLFLSGAATTSSWTPESAMTPLTGARHWAYLPGLSPDGKQITYTAYVDPGAQQQLRVYSYDVSADKTRLLIDRPRSQVLSVKSGWVWYLDETACDTSSPSAGCGPWGSKASGRVFAMNLTTAVESEVVFASGEAVQMEFGTYAFAPGEFWPNS